MKIGNLLFINMLFLSSYCYADSPTWENFDWNKYLPAIKAERIPKEMLKAQLVYGGEFVNGYPLVILLPVGEVSRCNPAVKVQGWTRHPPALSSGSL